MIDKIKKELCTGCDACYNVCPEDCVEMVVDNMGFRYPKVDYSKCTKCGDCTKTCPSLNKPFLDKKWNIPKVFAAWSLDEEIRLKSTSGGVFSELAKKVLEDGGIAVGARYNKQNLVEHHIIEDVGGLVQLRQSKYLQSDIGDILKKVEEKLLKDKKVVFCGSPCQVAGLLNYLKKPYDNLITFDFICRGANSPKAYMKYLEMIEEKYKSKIKRVWFKNKTHGWNRFSTRIDLENERTYMKDRHSDLYMRGYIEENLYMRPCCFECKYKTFPRVSDITLGDFWGVGSSDPALDPDKGTSLIMINSHTGENLFSSINKNIFSKESKLEAALPWNGCILRSVVKNPISEEFLTMLDNHPFDVCFNKVVKKI